MKCKYINKLLLFFSKAYSKKYRSFRKEHKISEYLRRMKLIMTFVVKNEESIIETNIRFHHAMGVDGVIVINHDSTDRTNDILEGLKKEGLVLEIIQKTGLNHQHSTWVGEMIAIAKKKYKADWIINADADEFFYSKSLNLKESIRKVPTANVLRIESILSFPADIEFFLHSSYFITRPFQSFEAEMLGILDDKRYTEFIGAHGFAKIIHATKNFKRIYDGNHEVKMRHATKIESADIILYHYHLTTFARFEGKVLRWMDSSHLMLDNQCMHLKEMVDIYKEGKLREIYDEKYNDDIRDFLIDNGVVTRDPSVLNFLKYKGIL